MQAAGPAPSLGGRIFLAEHLRVCRGSQRMMDKESWTEVVAEVMAIRPSTERPGHVEVTARISEARRGEDSEEDPTWLVGLTRTVLLQEERAREWAPRMGDVMTASVRLGAGGGNVLWPHPKRFRVERP